MHPTLLILAAGMGNRYGSLKQLDAMGPNGETVLDYSVHDAIVAGFDKVVFVIRKDFASTFQATIGNKFEKHIQVDYAFQELDDLPIGFLLPEDRQNPWGTAHAVLAARKLIHTPFALINADDFYGRDAFIKIAKYLNQWQDSPELRTCMIGYQLANTLSHHGSVNRGLCTVYNGILQTVEEHTEIAFRACSKILGSNLKKAQVAIEPDVTVSMNFWGFTPAIFASIEALFCEFLENHIQTPQAECYIPTIVDSLIRSGQTECAVIKTSGTWFGVTYPEDKPLVQASIEQLVATGEYPSPLA